MYKHILIPTDGSELSRKAVKDGVALAKALGARVTGLYAAPPATPIVYGHLLPKRYMTPQEHARLTEQAARKYLGQVEAAARAAGVACATVTVTSDFPAEAILAVAKEKKCDLIVMASHGRRGLQKMLLGSETQKVLAQAKLPVLVHR